MWDALYEEQLALVAATHRQTAHAQDHLEADLPLVDVLHVLQVSRATWEGRVQALASWRDAGGQRSVRRRRFQSGTLERCPWPGGRTPWRREGSRRPTCP